MPSTALCQRLAPRICAAALCCTLVSAHALHIQLQVVAQGLQNPWAVAFLPEGKFLVTERPGRMRVIAADGTLGAPLQGLPAIAAGGQGGLLDVVLDSDFAHSRTVYFCYSEPAPTHNGTNSTALAKAQLSADQTRLENLQVIFSQRPKKASQLHFGCRIVERRDSTLLLTLGERYHFKEEAQNLQNHLGKIVRIHKDGSVPKDNPFVGRSDALPEIWSYGHRNPQGAALAPDGSYWMNEHGPQGGDEINRPTAGNNYGWPVITYGENYGGGKIGDGKTHQAGMAQPVHHWTPSIAVSGMAFITSDRYPGWKGDMVVGALKAQRLERIRFEGNKISKVEHLLPDLGQRVRDVRQGPDGWLYVLTDRSNGQLLRLVATP
ncbi:PQQ-dependent sugar dehydrogenase [Comamonas aquatica]|uniref:PQQ-dependent sugar dehydrogenase n=1 Tax=Comamonas jiangduensis TaxID=1194168 RepID=UPI001C57C22F|nr:PQQ-dependent sugar dehydrogenase [Comamonas jiangduensis]QXW16994.1 PQQ-dependent sugar dehydrogenase [Comamonas aquatica]